MMVLDKSGHILIQKVDSSQSADNSKQVESLSNSIKNEFKSESTSTS
jgi:hypothetical protein